MNAPRPTLPLSLRDSGGTATLILGGVDITPFVAADGLRIDYGVGSEICSRPTPQVTITFAADGRLDLDFDIELLGRLLDDARAKVGDEG